MRHLLLTIAVSFVAAGCASTSRISERPLTPPPVTALSISPYPSLKVGLDALVPDTLFPPGHIGIKIVSLSRNEVLYELNSLALFSPASNEKLFTSATALARLGKDYELATVVRRDLHDTLRLVVKGYGDPILSTSDLDSIARQLCTMLPTGCEWTLAGDVSYFDDRYWGVGWNWDWEPDAYGMFITPLSVNGNAIDVKVRPGKKVGDTTNVQIIPPTRFVSLENVSQTVGDTILTPLEISRKWRERSNIVTVTGQILASDTVKSNSLSVWQPERYTLALLAERLVTHGVTVRDIQVDTGQAAGSAELVRFSHRLDSVVTFMNKVSDNLSAENLLKILAAEKNGVPGSASVGTSIVYQFLAELSIDTNRISIVDGSGLARQNLTSPLVVTQLLEGMYRRPELFEPFYASLPVAGVDGTIEKRMIGTRAQGNLRAKTGTLNGVTSLSGYVRTADDELLAFSILMNNFVAGSRPYRQVQDRIGVFLSGLRRESFERAP